MPARSNHDQIMGHEWQSEAVKQVKNKVCFVIVYFPLHVYSNFINEKNFKMKRFHELYLTPLPSSTSIGSTKLISPPNMLEQASTKWLNLPILF